MPSISHLANIIKELQAREIESLHLYEEQEQAKPFHRSAAPERLARGSNQSGKTLSTMVELVRAITNQDPHNKYPKKGLAMVVALDMRAISKVIWQNIGEPGAFKIIETEKGSGKYRTFKWWIDGDRAKEAIPAPPLLEERYIIGGRQGISWYEKKGSCPKSIRLHTGWEVHFLTSNGAPPQGWRGDLAIFDEEIEHEKWYPEIAARLISRGGMFIWDACPQVGSSHLYDLHEKADKEIGKPNPQVEEFFFLLDENPYVTDQHKKIFFNKLTDSERRIRYYGEYAFDDYKVFPEWDKHRHLVSEFPIPQEWTRIMVVDPGRQVLACLFVAIPPDSHELAGHVFFYDELYIKQATAELFGEMVAAKAKGQQFHTFIIDRQQSRQVEMGSGKVIEQQYTEALQARGVKSNLTGSGFQAGMPDHKAGILRCHTWLQPIEKDGHPKLQVFKRLTNFQNEIVKYHNASVMIGGERHMTDDPVKKNDHLMSCFRYVALYDPQYVQPVPEPKPLSKAYLAFQEFKRSVERMGIGRPITAVSLGPPGD